MSIRLTLSSRAENMAVVRAAITGIAEAVGFDEELTSDVKTAVSEACNNVSIHAYPDSGTGPLRVRVDCSRTGVDVTVTDHGSGITRISNDENHMGLGLAVINALSSRSQFRRSSEGGTEVEMFFDGSPERLPALLAGLPDGGDRPPSVFGEPDGHVVLWCSATEMQRSVLERVLWYMAASAHFSIDGIHAVRDVTGALDSHVRRTQERGWAGVCISSVTRALELTVGPLPRLDWDAELARHVDALEVQPINGHELLHFRVIDRAGRKD